MRRVLLASACLAFFTMAASGQEAPQFEAVLIGHAELPAQSFTPAPADAPSYFNVSGRFATGTRVETLYGVIDRNSGLGRPFPGQPLQGFSGIRSLGNDRFLVLTDNGFGSKANSADALLMFHTFKIDWDNGRVGIEKTIFLSDPNSVVPFPIVNEATASRYLTGADLDLESIQPVGDRFWIGDEFGPWLIEVDADGVVLAIVPTNPRGITYKSPDNPTIVTPDAGRPLVGVNTGRSGGYEGMAVSMDGTTLYPMLEKPFYDEQVGALETIDGRAVLRVLEFNVADTTWSDTIRYYPLEAPNHAIGDFNIIEDSRALVIERDSGQGDARDGWATNPAQFKRIYLVDLNETDANGVLRKIGYIDLMGLLDPDGIAPRGTSEGVFTFPFVTIEDVDRVSETVIVVANDNNYPGSVGREFGRADDNEFILLEVGDFLSAR